MPLLLESCPSFKQTNEPNLTSDGEHLVYLDLGDFARHLVDLCEEGTIHEFEAVFEVIERLYVRGDAWVQEAATIGLLESLQNNAGHQGIHGELFSPFFKPVSRTWWQALNDFWSGKTRYVGEGLDQG
ncbi:MAG TPA: hypothetical protein VGR43_07660 [Dehalococcoidia bacterium]|jgi:hypothetical protein|nr:hypothetical protein [Dehalococcoidia bacterium]